MIKKDAPERCSRSSAMTSGITTHNSNGVPWYHYNSTVRAKTQAQKLAAIYYRAGMEYAPGYSRRAQRVYMCHDTVGVQDGRIVTCWHCEDRLCPMCAVKMSRRIAANARTVIERARAEADLRPYLLTLTQRNCTGQELKERVSDMLKAWDAIIHGLRGNRKHVVGYARTVEITVGRDSMYHPHVHAILLMSPETPKDMLRARYWAALWQKYMQTQRYQGQIVPVCDIRPIRPNKRRHLSSMAAAAAEVAKYTAKSGQILSHAGAYEHILAIDQAISGRRLRSYGGVWRTIRAQMRLEDAISAGDPDARYMADVPLEVWQWSGLEDGGYHRIV